MKPDAAKVSRPDLDAIRAEEDKAGIVTCAEAREILSRFNASHWSAHDHEHARYEAALEVLRREAETRERAAAAVRGDYESLEYAAAVLLRELRRVLPEDGGIDRFDAVRRAMRTIASDGRPGWEERVLAGHGGIDARRREAETREGEIRAEERERAAKVCDELAERAQSEPSRAGLQVAARLIREGRT